jgi:hypothetical protein
LEGGLGGNRGFRVVVKLRSEGETLLRAKGESWIVLRRLLVGELEEPEVVRWHDTFRQSVEVVDSLHERICPVALLAAPRSRERLGAEPNAQLGADLSAGP